MEPRVRGVILSHPGCQELEKAGINSIGLDERPPGQRWGEGISGTQLLFLVVCGEIALPEAGLAVPSGNYITIPPSSPKCIATTEQSLVALWVHLRPGSFLLRSMPEPQISPAAQIARLDPIFRALLDESILNTSGSVIRCRHWSALALLYLAELVKTEATDTRMQRRLYSVWQEVGARLNECWTIERMSELAHLSEGHFHRQTRAIYGRSPQEILRQLRLERASGLLRTTDWTLDAIAAAVGYTTGFALSNAFQRCLGRRPHSFRHESKSQRLSRSH